MKGIPILILSLVLVAFPAMAPANESRSIGGSGEASVTLVNNWGHHFGKHHRHHNHHFGKHRHWRGHNHWRGHHDRYFTPYGHRFYPYGYRRYPYDRSFFYGYPSPNILFYYPR